VSSSGAGPTRPRVLFVYYTHTQQTLRVADAMAEVLRGRGCDVSVAGIEFTDPRYTERFSRFPFRHVIRDLLTVLPGQARRATGQIRIPDEAQDGEYDLVCFGSPTWFFNTNMPIRSYLGSDAAARILAGKRFAVFVVCRRYWSINLKEIKKLATKIGGSYVTGTRFTFEGGQIRSLLSLISYLGSGEMRERYLGVRIPPSNLKPDFVEQAGAFATELADALEPVAAQRENGGAGT
jgi:flavodoxin